MSRVVTFGEILLRLSPPGYARFVQADSFTASYGGAEANVAVGLAGLGVDAAFVTRLPSHVIGQAAVNALRRYGVDTSRIVRGGGRIGLYYLEKGASQRSSKVIYDRAGSAIAEAGREEFDWPSIFEGADWLHFTGVTPALGDSAAALCLDACRAAKAAGLAVSCDFNYRKTLWTREKAARVMVELLRYTDVCIAGVDDADALLKAAGTAGIAGLAGDEGCRDAARRLAACFGFSRVAVTRRRASSASDNDWGAMLWADGECWFSKIYPVRIIDRVGGGDSFGAGLIYACLQGMTPGEAVEFAAAASCLKHTIEGDFNLVTSEEVRALVQGDGAGFVQR